MHTYRMVADDDGNGAVSYQVGYYVNDINWALKISGDLHWVVLRTFPTESEAARYVNFLNGGRDFIAEETIPT